MEINFISIHERTTSCRAASRTLPGSTNATDPYLMIDFPRQPDMQDQHGAGDEREMRLVRFVPRLKASSMPFSIPPRSCGKLIARSPSTSISTPLASYLHLFTYLS